MIETVAQYSPTVTR